MKIISVLVALIFLCPLSSRADQFDDMMKLLVKMDAKISNMEDRLNTIEKRVDNLTGSELAQRGTPPPILTEPEPKPNPKPQPKPNPKPNPKPEPEPEPEPYFEPAPQKSIPNRQVWYFGVKSYRACQLWDKIKFPRLKEANWRIGRNTTDHIVYHDWNTDRAAFKQNKVTHSPIFIFVDHEKDFKVVQIATSTSIHDITRWLNNESSVLGYTRKGWLIK